MIWIAGVNVPTPRATDPLPPRGFLEQLRGATGATHLRVGWQPGCGDRLDVLRAWDWGLVVILYLPPIAFASEYGRWALELITAHPWLEDIELGNEPQGGPDGHYTAEEYAYLAIRAATVLHDHAPACRVWLAGEVYDVIAGRVKDYHQVVQRIVPHAWYHGVAIHPYRDPRPWDWAAHKTTRADEWAAIRAAVRGRPLLVSEVGWRLGAGRGWWRPAISEEDQAANLRGEVGFLRSAETCAGVCIYAHVGDDASYGLLRGEDWSPRPAALNLFRTLKES